MGRRFSVHGVFIVVMLYVCESAVFLLIMMAINAKFYPIRPSYETSDLAIVLKYPSPFQAQFGFTSLASNARYYYCGAYYCCCFLCCRRLSRVFLIRGVQEVRHWVLELTMGKMIEKTSLFQEQKSQSI